MPYTLLEVLKYMKNNKIKVPIPKERKPVPKRPNQTHKSKKDYDRKKNKDIAKKEVEKL